MQLIAFTTLEIWKLNYVCYNYIYISYVAQMNFPVYWVYSVYCNIAMWCMKIIFLVMELITKILCEKPVAWKISKEFCYIGFLQIRIILKLKRNTER